MSPTLTRSSARGVGIVGQLAHLHKAGVLGADVHLHLVGRNAGNSALHYLACEHRLEIRFASANISAKLISSRISSLILLSTSSIIDDGVEAPAVTPTVCTPENHAGSSSLAVSTVTAPGVLCGDCCQLLGVGRMMTTNDDHQVAFLAEVFRLLLPRPRRTTYCIKYFGVCIPFFYKRGAFLPFCNLKRGLRHHKKGVSAFWGLSSPAAGKDRQRRTPLCRCGPRCPAPPGWVVVAGHQQHRALVAGLAGDAVDLGHKGAGGVVAVSMPAASIWS